MHFNSDKPYDYFDAMENLRNRYTEMDTDERKYLKTHVALNASCPDAVALYVDLEGDEWASIYPPAPKPEKISTNKAIDTFLETYAKPSPSEDALLEKLIFNPVPEYAGMLAAEDRQQSAAPILQDETSPDNLAQLARQINASGAQQETSPAVSEPKTADQSVSITSPMSLELAKIFVKQGHFERAHDIILKISLNNPEKSAYFADQIRFLKKLILNEAYSKNREKA